MVGLVDEELLLSLLCEFRDKVYVIESDVSIIKKSIPSVEFIEYKLDEIISLLKKIANK